MVNLNRRQFLDGLRKVAVGAATTKMCGFAPVKKQEKTVHQIPLNVFDEPMDTSPFAQYLTPEYQAKLLPILSSLQGMNQGRTVAGVNARANARPYVLHPTGKPDFLLDPITYLKTSGSCQDAAVAKVAMLAALGQNLDDYRLIHLVRANQTVPHATLVGRMWGTFVILDIGCDAAQLAADYFHTWDIYYGQYSGPTPAKVG